MKKAVIFDLDGTLANTIESLTYCGNRALRKFGLPEFEEADYKYFVGDGAAVLVRRALVGAGYFDWIQGQMDGVPKKPDPTGVYQIQKKLGLPKEAFLYTGDTSVDMKTGKAAGMFTVGVLWGFRDRQELEENHADVIIERPAELLSLL